MFKKLPLALMMGAALTASNAFALGVGDIKVDSALNQRLNAEIELISSVEGELDDVTVSLAPPSAFERINLDRPYHLTSIKFQVTTRADGTPIVKLTSDETIREPFLDFLVEVNWPKGRMLREYTVLLDPPVSMAAPRPAPAPAATAGAEAGKIPYVPDPGEEVASGDDLGYPSDSEAAPQYSGGETFGPVEAQQTLWSIASQVRSGDVTTQQMMLALFDTNPDAFINGDIHHIKKGAVLRIPDYDTIVSRGRADAIAQVRQVNSSLDLAPTEDTTTVSPGIPEAVPTVTPAEPDVAADEPKLSIVAGGDAASASAASSDVEAMKRELALATESLNSQKMENDELKSRVMELESTVTEMTELKRLLEVQNTEMKQLQDQLSASQAEAEMPAAAEPEPMPEPEPVVEAEPEPVVEAEPEPVVEAEPEPVAEAEPEPVAEAEPEPTVEAESLPPPVSKQPMDMVMDYVNKIKNDPTLLSIVGGVLLILIALIALVFKRKGHVEDVGIVHQAAEVAEPKPSMFAGIKEKLQSLTKKKEKAEADEAPAEFEGFEEEDITDPNAVAPVPAAAEDQPVDATVFEAPSVTEDAGAVEDMMFEEDVSQAAPEMTPDAEAFEPVSEQPAGPDPLEEVDVYEAFGDFEQAAEIVNQAIADFPDNNSYKLRLFKVYESGGMKDEFSQAAVNHKDAMADSPEWGEVEQMGKVFAPESPAWGGTGGADATPFQSVAQPASAAGEDMAATMAMDSSMAAEVSESGADVSEPAPAAGDTNEIDFGDLDFELGGDTDEQPVVEASDDLAAMDMENTQALDDSANVAVAAGGDQPEVEFDMDSMDFESAEEPAAASPAEADNGLEFDLGDSLGAEPEQPAVQKPETDIGNELEFDLGDMDMEPQAIEEEATETVAVDSDADDMSMDFELDDVSDTPVEADTPTAELQDSSDTVALNISADELAAAASISEPEPASEDPTVMFTEEASADEGAEPEESIGVDLSDFSFDLDDTGESEALDIETAGSEAETVMLGDADDFLGEGLSAEGDEVATKLDLARAYIDMGDSEGAKGILDEVVAEGNDAQKAEAQELLQNA